MLVTTLNPLHEVPNRYAFDQPKYITYEGDVVLAPKWAADGTIALATGNLRWPVRLIDPSLIVSVDGETVSKSTVDLNVRTVTVKGSKGDSYVVTITPAGRSCTCAGFSFRHNCKHLKVVCE